MNVDFNKPCFVTDSFGRDVESVSVERCGDVGTEWYSVKLRCGETLFTNGVIYKYLDSRGAPLFYGPSETEFKTSRIIFNKFCIYHSDEWAALVSSGWITHCVERFGAVEIAYLVKR